MGTGVRGRAARVLTVNAGSTSLKLHVVDDDDVREVDGFDVAADAVGHRIVHGGACFTEPIVVDDEVEAAIAEVTPLAPLHNAPAMEALRRARAALPSLPHVAAFDTAFHATIGPEAATYALPERWRNEWGIRRYGFHGLAVQSVVRQLDASRIVACHLGGGCSVTAVRDGRSVDTTMGFTPLEGVPMATRSGSIDPGALLYAMREHGLSVHDAEDELQRAAGMLGLGGTRGVRDLLAAESAGDERAALALAVFVHRTAGAVAAMAAAMGGTDVVAFSGGIGERSVAIRDRVMQRVGFLDARVEVVPSREELVIAGAVATAL